MNGNFSDFEIKFISVNFSIMFIYGMLQLIFDFELPFILAMVYLIIFISGLIFYRPTMFIKRYLKMKKDNNIIHIIARVVDIKKEAIPMGSDKGNDVFNISFLDLNNKEYIHKVYNIFTLKKWKVNDTIKILYTYDTKKNYEVIIVPNDFIMCAFTILMGLVLNLIPITLLIIHFR